MEMHQSHYCQHTKKKKKTERNQLTSDSGGQSYVALSLLCTSISRDNGVSTKYYSAGSSGGRIVHVSTAPVIFQELMIQCRMLINAHVLRKHTQIYVFMLQ